MGQWRESLRNPRPRRGCARSSQSDGEAQEGQKRTADENCEWEQPARVLFDRAERTRIESEIRAYPQIAQISQIRFKCISESVKSAQSADFILPFRLSLPSPQKPAS